jgi:hypothetical protein
MSFQIGNVQRLKVTPGSLSGIANSPNTEQKSLLSIANSQNTEQEMGLGYW